MEQEHFIVVDLMTIEKPWAVCQLMKGGGGGDYYVTLSRHDFPLDAFDEVALGREKK